jgi:transcriptional regulator with XRE-family HTH domain
MSQEDLERESGVARATISALETGKREAQPRTIRRLSQALGVPSEELMKGEIHA